MDNPIDNILGGNTDDDRNKKSAYHGGMSYVQRIDMILQQINNLSVPMGKLTKDDMYYPLTGFSINQIELRVHASNVLFKEIFPKMNAEQKADHKQKRQLMLDSLRELKSFAVRNGQITGMPKFIAFLDDWELEIRAIIEEKGLLMPDRASGTDAASQ